MKRNVIYGLAVTGCAMALTVSTRIGAVASGGHDCDWKYFDHRYRGSGT